MPQEADRRGFWERAQQLSQAAVRNIEGSYVPSIRTKRRAVSPGGTLTDEYRFYMGPLLTPALKAYPGYVQLQDYGFFGSISALHFSQNSIRFLPVVLGSRFRIRFSFKCDDLEKNGFAKKDL